MQVALIAISPPPPTTLNEQNVPALRQRAARRVGDRLAPSPVPCGRLAVTARDLGYRSLTRSPLKSQVSPM